MTSEFERALQTVINYHSVDAELCLPDYVVARYMVICLSAFKNCALQNKGFREEAYKNEVVCEIGEETK